MAGHAASNQLRSQMRTRKPKPVKSKKRLRLYVYNVTWTVPNGWSLAFTT